MGNRPDHITELDGLRALAALSVFVSHAGLYSHYLATGRWELVAPVFTVLGQGGVALFFMITGFLFWGRLLRAHGRPDWRILYIGRVFRIGPLYLLAAAI